ncbi:thiol-disulfide isomerase and thioredoxin [Pseudoalteromonas luteoviolacea B = ATCC 29581]|nr:thiol-disulfide isomerase and thioredoxin [Pseudoalteromonas luteoviolacea B = ATCC 29581]
MPNIVLFHTEGCHLCEEAMSLLLQSGLANEIELCDIVDDQTWLERYQTSIPVVKRNDNGQQLYWPFALEKLTEFLK